MGSRPIAGPEAATEAAATAMAAAAREAAAMAAAVRVAAGLATAATAAAARAATLATAEAAGEAALGREAWRRRDVSERLGSLYSHVRGAVSTARLAFWRRLLPEGVCVWTPAGVRPGLMRHDVDPIGRME